MVQLGTKTKEKKSKTKSKVLVFIQPVFFYLTLQLHLLQKKRFSLFYVSSSFSGPAQSTCGYSKNASPCLSRLYTLMRSVLGFVI